MSRLASLNTPRRRESASPSPGPGASPSDLPGTPGSKAGPSGNGATTPKQGQGQGVSQSQSQSQSRSSSLGVITSAGETTHHRMLKLLINEFKTVFRTWDELVQMDGLKFGKGVIDEGTIMDNILKLEEGPERESVTPHLTQLKENRKNFSNVLVKLDKVLGKLSMFVQHAEKLLFEAYRTTSYEFVFVEPLWLTWTMDHFINSLPPLIHHHTLHLHTLTNLSQTILDSHTPFESSKKALERWLALSRGGERWEAVREWEELVGLEIELGMVRMGLGEIDLDEDDEGGIGSSVGDMSPGGAGAGKSKKKGKGRR